MVASVVSRIPLNLAELQFGITMRDIAAAYEGNPPSTIQIVGIVVRFCIKRHCFGGCAFRDPGVSNVEESTLGHFKIAEPLAIGR